MTSHNNYSTRIPNNTTNKGLPTMSVTIPEGSMFLRQHAEAVHAELVRLTGKNVTSNRKELEYTDLCSILDDNAMPFIHVAWDTGTAYYNLPLEYLKEVPPGDPYHYVAIRNRLNALATCHHDDKCTFYHYDGAGFRRIYLSDAIYIYVDTIRSLDAQHLLNLSFYSARSNFIRKCNAANENWNVSDYLVPTP